MMNEELIDKLERMKTGLISVSTDGSFDNEEYISLRNDIMQAKILKGHIPASIKSSRSAIEFRRNMQAMFDHYAERRSFITEEINNLINIIEDNQLDTFINSDTFEEIEYIGNGGYGEVYLYYHKILDMNFAIKFFSPLFVSQEEQNASEKRFFREAKILFELHCDNIVQVYDAGYLNGKPFIRMEYIDGVDLYKLIDKYSLIPFKNSLNAIIQILTGLDYAHKKRIIHRDLKPSNIMFSDSQKIFKIIDFGISAFLDVTGHTKLTKTGEHIAGGSYIDPQLQINPTLRDVRSDIYSVGAIWYYLLTGQVPSGADIKTQLKSIASISDEQADVVCKCLSYNLDDRYYSCEQLKKVIIELKQNIE